MKINQKTVNYFVDKNNEYCNVNSCATNISKPNY